MNGWDGLMVFQCSRRNSLPSKLVTRVFMDLKEDELFFSEKPWKRVLKCDICSSEIGIFVFLHSGCCDACFVSLVSIKCLVREIVALGRC